MSTGSEINLKDRSLQFTDALFGAAQYGHSHPNWDIEAVKGGLDRFKKPLKFNLNSKIRVRLTDYGRLKLRENHIEFWKKHGQPFRDYQAPKEDNEGWSEWQMHSLIEQLGYLCLPGSPLPFETEIEMVFE